MYADLYFEYNYFDNYSFNLVLGINLHKKKEFS